MAFHSIALNNCEDLHIVNNYTFCASFTRKRNSYRFTYDTFKSVICLLIDLQKMNVNGNLNVFISNTEMRLK